METIRPPQNRPKKNKKSAPLFVTPALADELVKRKLCRVVGEDLKPTALGRKFIKEALDNFVNEHPDSPKPLRIWREDSAGRRQYLTGLGRKAGWTSDHRKAGTFNLTTAQYAKLIRRLGDADRNYRYVFGHDRA